MVPDESGVLDDAEFNGKGPSLANSTCPGTTTLIKDWFNRHLILRANPTPSYMADWLNQLHAVAEECEHFVPVQVVSNSRNENGEVVFGMNDRFGRLCHLARHHGALPPPSGARTATGHHRQVRRTASGREWSACGLRKGYMYMADCVSDPPLAAAPSAPSARTPS